jgi:hypothetical protein
MALIIEIRENEKRIRGYSAERLSDKKQGWNQYLVKKFVPLPVPTLCQARPVEHEIFRIGVIRHKYEDGGRCAGIQDSTTDYRDRESGEDPET